MDGLSWWAGGGLVTAAGVVLVPLADYIFCFGSCGLATFSEIRYDSCVMEQVILQYSR
ncbi:hypothetical protein BP00DRAFT_427165 [Aspergillus indologenus CBS 114.80]|uniref:Uncharacterized protein n=1 Tax=Aspergillus indologenus CBS 114.80 TaxID=1450541 RepID=A0A2V5HZ72_9EURO|nr:hypothetical protein BP00DRAFT_427165 [Aspergillus indologenus CBS 114.80]